ncbi:MAG TPA: hypothetical protein ENJ41_05650, partial [Oceanospirillales bacterium]|nr:hypothetical protein [Oceanospirillales bacterium]
KIDEKLAVTVECKYFAASSEAETAGILDVNVRTIRRYWQRSKKWLTIEFTEAKNKGI